MAAAWDDLLQGEELAYLTTEPPRGPRIEPLPDDVHPTLRTALARQGVERLYADAVASGELGLPAQWGGFRVEAESVEFWQARENWLQDRLRYTRAAQGWQVERLMP